MDKEGSGPNRILVAGPLPGGTEDNAIYLLLGWSNKGG